MNVPASSGGYTVVGCAIPVVTALVPDAAAPTGPLTRLPGKWNAILQRRRCGGT